MGKDQGLQLHLHNGRPSNKRREAAGSHREVEVCHPRGHTGVCGLSLKARHTHTAAGGLSPVPHWEEPVTGASCLPGAQTRLSARKGHVAQLPWQTERSGVVPAPPPTARGPVGLRVHVQMAPSLASILRQRTPPSGLTLHGSSGLSRKCSPDGTWGSGFRWEGLRHPDILSPRERAEVGARLPAQEGPQALACMELRPRQMGGRT